MSVWGLATHCKNCSDLPNYVVVVHKPGNPCPKPPVEKTTMSIDCPHCGGHVLLTVSKGN